MPIIMVKFPEMLKNFLDSDVPILFYRVKFPEIKKFLAKFPEIRKFENWHISDFVPKIMEILGHFFSFLKLIQCNVVFFLHKH